MFLIKFGATAEAFNNKFSCDFCGEGFKVLVLGLCAGTAGCYTTDDE